MAPELGALMRATQLPQPPTDPAAVREAFRVAVTDTARGADRFRDLWRRLLAIASAGGPEAVQPERDNFVRAYRRTVEDFESAKAAAAAYQRRFGEPLPEADRLEAAADDLTAFAEDLFERWETADDLAAILTVERLTRSAAELARVAPGHPPPQSWYDETADPFRPAE